MTSAKLKSRQQCFLSKPPNIMFVHISAYTVCINWITNSTTTVYWYVAMYDTIWVPIRIQILPALCMCNYIHL